MPNPHPLHNRLPPSLRMIYDVAGLDAAMGFALAFGGRLEMIPHKPTRRLIGAVGEEEATLIVAHLFGERFKVPLLKRDLAKWLHQKGMGKAGIAHKLKVSRNTIQRWTREDLTHPDLFDSAS